MSKQSNAVRILPYSYIHVRDINNNITRLEVGPQIFIKKENEVLKFDQPKQMLLLTPYEYCIIQNPVVMGADNQPIYDANQQVKVVDGELEYRTYEKYSEPFPLYPGEELQSGETHPKLTVIEMDTGLKIKATRSFTDSTGTVRIPGEEWMIEGLATYYPRVEEEVVETVKASVIKPQTALMLKATEDFVDRNGTKRFSKSKWLVRSEGSYLPGVFETVVETRNALVLTETNAVILTAAKNFTDVYGVQRKAGEMWLLTNETTSSHILDCNEVIDSKQNITVLKDNQYCFVCDPFDDKTKLNKLNTYITRTGPTSFFLKQGERMHKDIYFHNYELLTIQNSIIVVAQEKFTDADGVVRNPGDRWQVYGPQSYLLPKEVNLERKVQMAQYDENEGTYIKNLDTG